jgi:bacillithiol biosynthesis cysteine-adding enzyme BshC
MPNVRDISFHQVPHQSNIFLSYIDLAAAALEFFQRSPTLNSLELSAKGDLPKMEFQRAEMTAILRLQNTEFGADSITLQQISELEHSDCVAILTGQQAGIFGGPLYTVYKAVTALRLASELRAKHIRAVPIFWMDTEDHDLAEVAHATLLADLPTPLTVDYRESLIGGNAETARPVGNLKFLHSIREAVGEYCARLQGPESDATRALLESAYQPGRTLAESFGRLMSQLFAGRGLILFDPGDPRSKPFVSSVFQKALREADSIHATLTERNHALEAAGFHTQVKVQDHSSLLFLLEGSERHALLRQNEGFRLKNSERHFSLDELLTKAAQRPESFSPNVLLRPIVQDHLFPTICYVGGPAEVAYFAQIEALYNRFGRRMPIIWPRSSFTLIELELAAEMHRLGVQMEDCFGGSQHLTSTILHSSQTSGVAEILGNLETRIEQTFNEIRPGMEAAEASLANALNTSKRKILHHTEGLRTKFARLESARNDSVAEQVQRIQSTCFPERSLQERVLGIHEFSARHGVSLLDLLYSLVDLGCFAHRIVHL